MGCAWVWWGEGVREGVGGVGVGQMSEGCVGVWWPMLLRVREGVEGRGGEGGVDDGSGVGGDEGSGDDSRRL